MNENTISIASEIVKAKNEPVAASSSIASQILAEQKRRREIEGKLAEDQNKRIAPELQAEAIPIAKANSLPIDVARRNLDVLKAEQPQPDLDKAKTDAPSYGKVLQDNAHGPIAQSAVSEMPYFERVLRSYGQAFSSGFEDLEASDIGYRRMQGTATPQDLERFNQLKEQRKQRTDFRIGPVAEFFQYPVQSAPATGTTVARTWDEVLIGAGTGAAAGLVTGPGAVGGAVTGAGVGARVGFVKESFEQLAGDAYNEALEALDENGNPLDEDSAYTIAAFAGGVGAVAELLPFEKALDTMPFLKGVVGKEGARRLAALATRNPAVRGSLSRMGRILKVGGAEAFTEVLQEATKLEAIIAAGGVTDAEGNVLADQRVDRYTGAAVGGFAGGTTLGAAGEAITATVEGAASLRARRAEAKQQALAELGERIRGSRVNGLSPETVVAHAKQMDADGAAPQMSAPAEALVNLFQSEGLTAEQVQEQFPTLAQAIDEAAQTGAEVTLNAETVVKLARLEKFADITGDIRTSPDELTANEAKQADVEFNQMLESMSEEDIAKAVNASVHKDVMNQLVAAGTDPKVAETQAKLFTSVISNLAERTGMQPDQLLQRYGLTITGNESVDTAAADPTATMLSQEAPGFRVDNPGGSWLAEKQARAEADLAEGGKGIRGADTASIGLRQPITLPVEMLSQLRGVNDEVRAPGNAKFDELAQSVDQQGYTNESPVVVVVNHRGEAFLNEGNTRVAVAKSRNVDRIAATVYWMNGAEQTPGAWSPDQVLPVAQPFAGEPAAAPEAQATTPEEQAAVDAASLDNSNTLSQSQAWQKGRDLKLAMQDRVLAALQALGIDPSKRSPEAIRYLVKVGVKDALAALAQNPNAIGWYDVKTRQALAVMSLVHPEIMTEPNARFAFTWALAVTSNGIKVGKNFELADAVYRRYKADGRMPTDIQAGQAQKAINESLNLFNELAADWGMDNLRQFMLTDFKVSEISGINKELTPSGEFADTLVRGAAVLGPKIGNGFFSNLYGVFDALTMDRWLVRTWGRWTGTLIQINEEQVAGARDVLRGMADNVDIPELAKQLRAVKKTTKTKGETEVKPADRERLIAALEAGWDTDAKVDDLAAAVQKASQEPKFRSVMNDVAGGKELRTKGNNLAKYLDGQKEQPAGPAERNYIREVFQGILDEVRAGDEKYAGLTMADLQAVLWYAEKRLYETAKEDTVVADDVAESGVSGYEDEEAPDYANAAAAQARADGVPDDKIKATLKQEADRGSATRAGKSNQPGAGSPQGNDTGGQGGRAQAARGFTRPEKRSFIQRAAIHRIRSNRTGDEAASWSYARSGGEDGGRPRLLKKLGVRYTGEWKAGQKLRTAFKANGILTPTIYELETGSAQNAARFVSAIEEARKSLGAIGEAVKVYPADEYAAMRLFLSDDGKAGFALKPDGDIISVFSAKGTGAGRAVMETAIAAGGKKLDCFDTILPDFYSVHGFRGTSRLLWNDEIAMADMPSWDKKAFAEFNNGEPDVVFMVYDPAYMGGYDRESTPLFEGDNAYGEALGAQEMAVEDVAAGVTTLEQRAQATTSFARGSISFTPARDKFKITLTGKADLSTFMHESAHYFLEVIQDLVEKGDAPAQLVEDLSVIRQWVGIEPSGKMGPPKKFDRVHHEKFARGFEAYLMEGRAPSTDLQSVFNKFRAWLTFIYKKLTALNVELTDDVRGVMDRLVASDREIAEARTNVGWSKPLPKEALYLSDDEYDRYVEAWNKANEAQQREVDAGLMLEAAREAQKAWKEERAKVFDEEMAKLSKTRGYRAWKLLSEGKGLEAVRPGWSNIKIDPASIPSEWRRDAAGMTAPATESGLPLETVAEILGFNTGEEMLSTIAGAKFANRELPRQVRKIMDERHGALDMTALADLAMQAVHSDKTQEVLLTEYRAMASRAGLQAIPVGMTKWMAAQAQQRVLGLTRRQLDPMRWRRAELKASEQAAKAKDPAQAALYKRQQLMAAAMYKATTDAQKRVETIRNKLLPFTKNDRRAKLGKAGDLYLDGIDEILEGVQLKRMSAASVMKLDRLAKLVEEAEKKGEPLVLPDKLRAMLGKKNFADMTLEELEGVHDSVMNIWHLAKTKNELKARAEKRDLENLLTDMEQTALANLGDPKVQESFTKSRLDQAREWVRWGRAQLIKMEFLFGWLDGKPSGGLMHRYIYQPLADANREEFAILKRFNEQLFERLRNMPAAQKARWDSKRTFMGRQANGATIISAALNLGNEGNKQKLLEGYGWNEQRLMAQINAFMTKEDWDLVQHIWDQIDTLWPNIEATTKAATGLPPEKVVPSPIATPFGTYAGGYYPVVYDPDQVEQAFKNQQKEGDLFTNNFARPTLGDGFTKARVTYSAPILLDLAVISRHLSEVVHYVTHYEAVTQADKITRHPRFQKIVKEHMGLEFYREIRPWLQDIARAQDTPGVTQREILSSAMRHLRGGVSIASMGYNIFTGFTQLLGVTTALDAVKPRFWASGVQKAWLSPSAAENWRFAWQNSAELEPLVKQVDRDIAMINDIYMKKTTGRVMDAVVRHAFTHIGYFQLAVNMAAWHGAYEQALSAGLDQKAAIDEADSVVRKTQSSGAIKDLSAIQRGSEATRMVSMFYSWFSVLYNRLEDIARETKSIKDVPKAARRLAVLVFLSAMLEETFSRAYQEIVGSGEDEEDDKGFLLTVGLKGADMVIASVPLLRAFVSVEGATGGFTPEISPVMRVGADYWRMVEGLKDLVADGELPTKGEIKSTVKTVSVVTGKPIYGIYRLGEEFYNSKIFDK